MRETLKEFIKDYPGFDFDNGIIVLVKRSRGTSHIIENGTCWTILLEKYSNEYVWDWNHTETVMVITLEN